VAAMKVRDILKVKGPQVYSIGKDKTVKEAIINMCNNHVGALVVIDDEGQLVGIITERDILNLSGTYPDNIQGKIINDVMSKKTIIAEPDDDIDYVEMVMTGEFIRHLPILQDNHMVGIISIGDIVKAQRNIIKYENKYLRDYINGVRT
jgi:CBS domain-containing protein